MQNNELVKAIKSCILEDVEKEEVIAELKRYKRNFESELDYNWYQHGNILPFYAQIRDLYRDIGIIPPEDCGELQEHFERHVRTAIDELLEENE